MAILYVALMLAFGDAIARRCFSYVSRTHRMATAFLVGLVLSTWLTYLASFALMSLDQPLIPGDAVAMAIMAIVALPDVWFASRRWRLSNGSFVDLLGTSDPAHHRSERWDWILVGALTVFVTWMMTSTFSYVDGQMRIGIHEWGDLGPNAAIAQGFALGHNFPTEYPLFSGEPILYHFLYQFQVGNLTVLGFDPATANNVLSAGSMVALLVLVMALGERLFKSVIAGRIGALLFFAHGSLSFIPFLGSFPSPGAAIDGVVHLDHYLVSVFPYHGEDWAVWSQNVYLNQRHLASGIAILILVIFFVIDRLTVAESMASPAALAPAQVDRDEGLEQGVRPVLQRASVYVRTQVADPGLPGYLLCGVLLGLLPYWNSAIYLGSAVVLGICLLVFPNRVQLLVMAVPAAVLSIPQVILLRPASDLSTQYPLFHWGFVIDNPTVMNVAAYVGFLFGPKLILAAVALVAATRVQRGLFLAVSALFALTFLFQLTPDIVASHKFINVWLIVVNVYAAYGLICLWRARPSVWIPNRLVVAGLAVVIAAGGVIDLFPIKNDTTLAWQMQGDPEFEWVRQESDPRDVFLSDVHVIDPILLAGRRLYYGWPVYAWSAGYDTVGRDADYRQMLEERSLPALIQELHANGIAYVAIDDGLRKTTYVAHLNEDLYAQHFQAVFTQADHGNLVIYKVPAGVP